MIDGTPRVLTLVAAVSSGLVAGVFFAFSSFVMPALRRLPDAEGISAMQAINKAAPTPVFMSALFGTAAVALVVGIWALTDLDEPWAPYQLAGSVLYLSCIARTGGYHVPRNNALDRVDPTGAGAPEVWRRYLEEWTRWNHARVVGPLAAAVVSTLALRAT